MKIKTKYTVAFLLSLALAGVVLTGCGESGQPQSMSREQGQDMAEEEAEPKEEPEIKTETGAEIKTEEEMETTEENPETEQASEIYEDNFAVDSQAAKEFAEKVKEAVAQKDLEALAELTSFPVYVGLPDVGGVETKEEFLKLGADAVFTDALLESVEAADIENFKPSMAGFSISGGGTANINFGVVDGRLAVSGINY